MAHVGVGMSRHGGCGDIENSNALFPELFLQLYTDLCAIIEYGVLKKKSCEGWGEKEGVWSRERYHYVRGDV